MVRRTTTWGNFSTSQWTPETNKRLQQNRCPDCMRKRSLLPRWPSYLQYRFPPYLSPFAKCLEGVATIIVYTFFDVSYWPPYSTESESLDVVPGPSQWFFLFGEEIVIAWTHIGRVRWMFQNLPFPAAQEDRDSSKRGGVIPCIAMNNYEILYHQVSPHASSNPWKHSSVLQPRATSIFIQERCCNFVNMVLGRSHYPYESQRSTHCSRFYRVLSPPRWLH